VRFSPYIERVSPLVWLAITVVFVVIVALTGTGPKGGKPVARTRLMKTARIMFIVAVFVCGGLGVAAYLHR
jgi:hypothetical protein